MTHIPSRRLLFPLLLAATWAGVALGDWLVTEDGRLLETQGKWTIDGEIVRYTDLEGKEQSLPLEEVDVEGSAETTALKLGVPYVPILPEPVRVEPKTAQTATKGRFPALKEADRPPVILYSTSWCGYCRKARALLHDLDVDFVEKDIERDRAAAREMRMKSGGRGGVPVLDIGGEILLGYSDRRIRRMVKELHEVLAERQAAAGG
jgi:glutaredoxin